NTYTCPVCLGHPGTLPALNREAYRLSLKAAVALNCDIARRLDFDRKHYYYPDLAKGFQISQHYTAVGSDGYVTVWDDERNFYDLEIERVHLEEDVAKGIHEEDFIPEGTTYLDYNRSGVPLMEVVGEPVIRSAAMARRYLTALRATLREADISDCNLAAGAFRIDTNISMKPVDSGTLGTQVELKNLNSFRSVERALKYEIKRQTAVLEGGGEVLRETRHFDEHKGETWHLRTKEVKADYRFFPEPDLPPLEVDVAYVEDATYELPPAPSQRVRHILDSYPVDVGGAETIAFAEGYYPFLLDATAAYSGDTRKLVNWLVGDVSRELHERGTILSATKLTAKAFAKLASLVDEGRVNVTGGREVLAVLMDKGGKPEGIVETEGLEQVSDADALEAVVAEAIEANPKAVADIKAGKDRAKGAIVGYVMIQTRGKANPKLVNELIDELLG
ncbi:MAG: Asp-tRNA(Asn)/Glu-tRNA(Gln) amidotransferase subunit GatB, partial [bacterium]|nr:Asp-tRNA(Asn)/Glu-tRNA(Gln) amidotransferase subunit GatB [bacterium]